MKNLIRLNVVLTSLAISNAASAHDFFDADGAWCQAFGGGDPTSENHFRAYWAYSQPWIDFFWYSHDFDVGDWSGGFGYSDVNNTELPLGRTFNALALLNRAVADSPAYTNDFNGTILRWGGNYVNSNVDEFDGRCGPGGERAHTAWGPIIDNYTALYMPFFIFETVVERAGTLMHEARHADGWGHNAYDDSNCARGASCDSHWDYWGANTYQVYWLWYYWWEGWNAPAGSKAQAKFEGNMILEGGYVAVPPFRIVCGTAEDPC